MLATIYYYLLLAVVLLVNGQAFAAEKLKFKVPECYCSVRPGNNLIHISRQHLINPDDWHMLQKLNQIKNPFRIPPGKVLRLPLHLVKQLPAPAEVVFSTGKAGILSADKSIEPVTAGQQLTIGTELVTGEKK